jgi:hypothetical protein
VKSTRLAGMVDAPRADVDRAFEAYGRLMTAVAGFEQVLRLILGEFGVAKLERAGKASSEELKKLSTRILRLDMGGLIQQVCDKLGLTPEMRAALKEAKGFRDYLAHNFWGANLSNLHSARGVEIVIAQCQVFETGFREAGALIVQATKVDVLKYVLFLKSSAADEAILAGWEDEINKWLTGLKLSLNERK